jgi:hypothetical protein
MRRAWSSALALTWLLASIACDGGAAGPSERPSGVPPTAVLALEVPETVQGRYVACDTCEVPLVVVAEFDVTVGDPRGPGGILERVEVVASDLSRGTVYARNARPNRDVALANREIPAGGTLTAPAGIVIAPAPPPRDSVALSIVVALTDGRTSTRTVPLAVLPGS